MPNSTTVDSETIILGGGLSGLAVAHYLGGASMVLEAEEAPGGLCRTFKKDGFSYDIGGHILFSRNDALLQEMVGWLGDNVLQQRRQNIIWYKDRFVKYPFENGLSALEKDEILEILLTFLNRSTAPPANFAEWCVGRFGAGLAEKYLLPYNRKIWKRPLETMSQHWVERIPSPPLEDILKSAIGMETEGYTHQLYFHYPREGGIAALITALARKSPQLRTGFRVSRITKRDGAWEVSDGRETLICRTLINTMPIFTLLRCLEDVPSEVERAVAALQYNALLVVMVGVSHERMMRASAVYIPDEKILPHRTCFMRYFSPHTAPAGCSHLAAEITLPPGDPLLNADDETLTTRVIADVKALCDFTEREVVSTAVSRIPYAYPIYDQGYLHNTGIFRDYLAAQGLHSTGRFANFVYINMDQCVEMAKALVNTIHGAG